MMAVGGPLQWRKKTTSRHKRGASQSARVWKLLLVLLNLPSLPQGQTFLWESQGLIWTLPRCLLHPSWCLFQRPPMTSLAFLSLSLTEVVRGAVSRTSGLAQDTLLTAGEIPAQKPGIITQSCVRHSWGPWLSKPSPRECKECEQFCLGVLINSTEFKHNFLCVPFEIGKKEDSKHPVFSI